jgi:peptidoglycan/xylan/chitin deacetylase (PgdA/CDA1 family)
LNVPILVYHRIPKDAAQRDDWALPLDDFRAQMAYLARNSIAVCPLNDFWEAYRTRRPLGQNSVVLTFDDGYAATCENVEGVLDQYGYPATLFLTTGVIGQRDPLHARDEGVLTWEQVRTLRHLRVEAHTVTHPRLSLLDAAEARREVQACKGILEDALGRAINHFAYPYGGYNRMVRAEVRNAGYESAYAAHLGPATFQDDPFQFHRILLDGRTTLDVFARRVQSGFLSRREEAAARVRTRLFRVPGVHDLAEHRKARRA